MHVRYDNFVVRAPGGKEQRVKITSGQTAPAPAEFTVGKQKFTLYTFEAPNGTRLEPDHLMVQKSPGR